MLKTDSMKDTPSTPIPPLLTAAEIPWSESFLSRPTVVWNGLTLCHGQLKTDPVVVTDEQIFTLLAEIYPDKNLIDLFYLLYFFQTQNIDINGSALAKAYGFHWTEYHFDFLKLYSFWPETFLLWTQQKNLQITDLRPLLLLKNNPEKSDFLKILIDIVDSRASYSEGKTLIELTVDLFCQKIPVEKLAFGDAKDTAQWISRLKKLRYPLTHDMDQAYKTFVEKQRWPLPCQFKRQGDKKGFQVSVFITSPNEVEKSKQGIEQSLAKISEFYEDQK